ncbi:MAG: response regulator, partial [Spirochaetales bacterium]|nr:response regulator [Spirochaetales bacterium]
AEQLESIDSAILALKDDPGRDDSLAGLLRSLHTIKGSSRMLKFKAVEALAHGLENVFKGVKEGRYGITRDLVRLVFLTGDAMRRCSDAIRATSADDIDTAPFLSVFERVYASEPFTLDGLAAPEARPAPGSQASGSPAAAEQAPSGAADAQSPQATPVQAATPVTSEPSAPAERRQADKPRETIRIDLGRIDGIVRVLNNLIIKQFQFRKEKDLVARVEDALGDAGGGGKEAVAVALRATRQLRKKLDEDLELMERNTFELQEDILSLRMLPLELILGNLGKMVEETSAVLGKDIRLSTSGTELLLDKFILEGLHDPIVHIVRNSIDHGLETPEERVAKGKDPVGNLSISCASESGHIVIRIRDDGRGLDYARIRQRAIDAYPSQAADIAELPEASLNAYLFMSGFSTKDEISDLSGRGVGLDIVRHNIESIKGKIDLSSEPDRGTEFSLSLPLSMATVDGFFITSAGEKFLIPATFVREVIIVQANEVMDLLNRRGFVLRNLVVPLYPLSVLLGKGDDDPFDREKLNVVVIEAFGEIMGLMVDSIVQYTTLIYKPVPRNLSGLKTLQGIVFDENFDIITILFVPELMNRCKRIRNIDTRKRYAEGRRENKRILVVDDSPTTREIEKSILEIEDYQVSTAVDGIDGLDKLREQKYHLIVTDINMPRMDGLTFVENLRKLEGYAQTPVIVVSSEDDEGHRTAFRAAGATSFIVKSDFERENLVERVKALIGAVQHG